LQTHHLRIGTRGSPLALAQAELVRTALCSALSLADDAVAIAAIRTTGDMITDRPLSEAGGKGLFTKEIDEALLDGRVDLAVHSAKDLETRLPDGIVIAGCLVREDVRDAFLSPVARRLVDLPQGATVGTASLRRRALVLLHRPDIRVVSLRGNVQTRLRKLDEGVADATLLAQAGLSRLGLGERAASLLEVEDWPPAAGQGTVAITARADDADVMEALQRINHAPTATALVAERAFLHELDGSCRTPIGGLARLDGDALTFDGLIVRPDGTDAHRVHRAGAVADGEAIGRAAGRELAARGGPDYFAGS